MAFLVSLVSFSFPIYASTRTKERNPWKVALDRPFRRLTHITATELRASSSLTDSISPPKRNCCGHCLAPLRHHCEVVTHSKSVDSCTHAVISGFWVGPDVEDGWGIVDAFVNRII